MIIEEKPSGDDLHADGKIETCHSLLIHHCYTSLSYFLSLKSRFHLVQLIF